MNAGQFGANVDANEQDDYLTAATIRYLFSLPAEAADAALRCAILRWFDPQVLEGVSGPESVQKIELPETPQMSAEEKFQRVCEQPFVEEFPDRGFAFHDETRRLVLKYLQKNELDYYRQVSLRAAEYFYQQIEGQRIQEVLEPYTPIDLDLFVEVIYHLVMADEEEGIDFANGVLFQLDRDGRLGTYFAILQALSEHVKAGRGSSELELWVLMWKIDEAFANFDIQAAEALTEQAIQTAERYQKREFVALAHHHLADGLLGVSHYRDAQAHYESALQICNEMDLGGLRIIVLYGLGMAELNQLHYDRALVHFNRTLEAHTQVLRLPTDEDWPEEWPAAEQIVLRVAEPDAWMFQELQRIPEEDEDGGEAAEEELPEAPYTPEPVIDEVFDAVGGNDAGFVEEAEEEIPDFIQMYFVAVDGDRTDWTGLGIRQEELDIESWPVTHDNLLGSLFLRLGQTYYGLEEFEQAAAWARLSAQVFFDLDDTENALFAIQLMRWLGVAILDPELKELEKTLSDLPFELLDRATSQSDARAQMAGLIETAALLHLDGKFDEAQENYQQAYDLAIEHNKLNDQATAMDGFARVAWSTASYAKAIENFQQALALYERAYNREGRAESAIAFGNLLMELRRFDQAEQVYQQALEIYDQLQQGRGQQILLIYLSRLSMAQGDYREAFDRLARALSLAQGKSNYLISQEAMLLAEFARLHTQLGHYAQAEEFLEKAVSLVMVKKNRGLLVDVLNERGDLLLRMGEYQRAIGMYSRVLDIDPENLNALQQTGWALENLDPPRPQDALAYYKKARQKDPSPFWIDKSIAHMLWQCGDHQAAKARYRKVVKRLKPYEKRGIFLSTLAWCYYHLGQFEKAEQALLRQIDQDPEPFSDIFDLGLVRLCQHKWDESLDAYRQGVDVLDDEFPPLMRVGWLHVAIGDIDEAVRDYPEIGEAQVCAQVRELLRNALEFARSHPELSPGA